MTDKETALLEDLRKKARSAYLYLALGLLAAVAVFFLLKPLYGFCFGVFMAAAYVFFLKKDIDRFRHQYKKTVLAKDIGRYIKMDRYVPENLMTLEQISKEGCVPIENTKGIVRAGVTGTWRGQKISMTDISYVYKMGGKRQALAVSGCYLRLERRRETDEAAVFCSRGVLPEGILDDCYGGQGLTPLDDSEIPESLSGNWRGYGAGAPKLLKSARICEGLSELGRKSGGQMILKWAGKNLYVFVRFRYLGACEPDYKTPVAEKQLEKQLFPELKIILEMDEDE